MTIEKMWTSKNTSLKTVAILEVTQRGELEETKHMLEKVGKRIWATAYIGIDLKNNRDQKMWDQRSQEQHAENPTEESRLRDSCRKEEQELQGGNDDPSLDVKVTSLRPCH